MQYLTEFLGSSYTAYQAVENAKKLLTENGFTALSETDDWELSEGGKYFVERGGSALIAFTVDGLDRFAFKIAASHTDSPALKIKENPVNKTGAYATLNVEKYGGGILYSFFDRPLKIAGRFVVETDGGLQTETFVSDKIFTVPSVAIHQNRTANDGFSPNPQIDLQPLFSLGDEKPNFPACLTESAVIAYDLYLVNADTPYSFGLNSEFLASPRIDDLACVCASLQSLINHEKTGGICVAACFDSEEIGSQTLEGAGCDFLENTLKRIAFAFKFDEEEYYKALASSFLVSADNAHAMHPNHPEKCDPTNKTVMGGGVVIKSHANRAYTTDALSAAVLKTVFNRADVKHQPFYNRSDMASGRTLGGVSLSKVSVASVDIGLPQLAMHSACECFAKCDYQELVNGLQAYFSSEIVVENGKVQIF
ncbi:MAG: M18 family aminopeptidase [Clostridia bacterium]|nr:M18 family aminopeptidase [Clostridia bacterium]